MDTLPLRGELLRLRNSHDTLIDETQNLVKRANDTSIVHGHCYGDTNIETDASAVLGDIIHNYVSNNTITSKRLPAPGRTLNVGNVVEQHSQGVGSSRYPTSDWSRGPSVYASNDSQVHNSYQPLHEVTRPFFSPADQTVTAHIAPAATTSPRPNIHGRSTAGATAPAPVPDNIAGERHSIVMVPTRSQARDGHEYDFIKGKAPQLGQSNDSTSCLEEPEFPSPGLSRTQSTSQVLPLGAASHEAYQSGDNSLDDIPDAPAPYAQGADLNLIGFSATLEEKYGYDLV